LDQSKDCCVEQKSSSFGLVAVQVTSNTEHKNATDIALIIAAMDILTIGMTCRHSAKPFEPLT
jgi:hypothetical protein